LKKVVLAAAYQPAKSLFGPKEILKVRVKDGVANLEVVRKTIRENSPSMK
jgi:hypothetical protein